MDSNPQPADYKSAALPIELHRHVVLLAFIQLQKRLFTPFLFSQPIKNFFRNELAVHARSYLLRLPLLPYISASNFCSLHAKHRKYGVSRDTHFTTLNASPFGYCVECGALGRNRTTDRQIFSLLLYRLSYQGIWRPKTGSNRRPPA